MNQITSTSDPSPKTGPFSPWRAQQGLWIAATILLGLFLLLAMIVFLKGKPYFPMELVISQAVQSISWPGFEGIMRAVSLPGDSALWFATMIGAACLLLLIGSARRTAAILFGIVLVAQVLKVGVKHLIARPRPTVEVVDVLAGVNEIYSFPSGHTVLYTVFFGFIWYIIFAKVKTPAWRWLLLGLFIFMVLAIGVSRIYLGAHWLSDVLGGYLLGGAILAAGLGLDRAWNSSTPKHDAGTFPM